MSATVGTWAWAEQTHGRLSRRDQLTLVRQGIVARLERLPGRGAKPLDPGALPAPPDSAIATAAEELCRELSSPELYGHCLRTWAFSALFAARDRVAHDPELLYVAALLHDLGLTPAHDRQDPTAECFAVEGARAAHRTMCEHGAPEDRARTVAEAITLHLNVNVPARLGAEAALMSKGVSLDVVGRRATALPAASLADVHARWPRDGVATCLITATKEQARVRPQSRARLLHQLGFAGLITSNPLDS